MSSRIKDKGNVKEGGFATDGQPVRKDGSVVATQNGAGVSGGSTMVTSLEANPSGTCERERRRQEHNEMEKRRKDKIKMCINKIGELLPPIKLTADRERPSTLEVVEKALCYIKQIKDSNARLLKDTGSIVQAEEIERLQAELGEVKEERDKLLEFIKTSGLPFPTGQTSTWDSKTFAANKSNPQAESTLQGDNSVEVKSTNGVSSTTDPSGPMTKAESPKPKQKTKKRNTISAQLQTMRSAKSQQEGQPQQEMITSSVSEDGMSNPAAGNHMIGLPGGPFMPNQNVMFNPMMMPGSGQFVVPGAVNSTNGMLGNSQGDLGYGSPMSANNAASSSGSLEKSEEDAGAGLLQLAMQDAGITPQSGNQTNQTNQTNQPTDSLAISRPQTPAAVPPGGDRQSQTGSSTTSALQTLASVASNTQNISMETSSSTVQTFSDPQSRQSVLMSTSTTQTVNSNIPIMSSGQLQGSAGFPPNVLQAGNTLINMPMMGNQGMNLIQPPGMDGVGGQVLQQGPPTAQQQVMFINEQGVPVLASVPVGIDPNNPGFQKQLTGGAVLNSMNQQLKDQTSATLDQAAMNNAAAMALAQQQANMAALQGSLIPGGQGMLGGGGVLQGGQFIQQMSAQQAQAQLHSQLQGQIVGGQGQGQAQGQIQGMVQQAGQNNMTLPVSQGGNFLTLNTMPSQPNQLPSALILPNGQIIPVVTNPQNVASQQGQTSVGGQVSSQPRLTGTQFQPVSQPGPDTMTVNPSLQGQNQVLVGPNGQVLQGQVSQSINGLLMATTPASSSGASLNTSVVPTSSLQSGVMTTQVQGPASQKSASNTTSIHTEPVVSSLQQGNQLAISSEDPKAISQQTGPGKNTGGMLMPGNQPVGNMIAGNQSGGFVMTGNQSSGNLLAGNQSGGNLMPGNQSGGNLMPGNQSTGGNMVAGNLPQQMGKAAPILISLPINGQLTSVLVDPVTMQVLGTVGSGGAPASGQGLVQIPATQAQTQAVAPPTVTTTTTAPTAKGKKKNGQRAICPKPSSSMEAPPQNTVTSSSKKKKSSQKMTKEVDPLPDSVSDGLQIQIAESTVPEPDTSTQTAEGSTATDILGKAVESLFTDMSPPIGGFYNPANEDNPLHIDTSAADGEEDENKSPRKQSEANKEKNRAQAQDQVLSKSSQAAVLSAPNIISPISEGSSVAGVASAQGTDNLSNKGQVSEVVTMDMTSDLAEKKNDLGVESIDSKKTKKGKTAASARTTAEEKGKDTADKKGAKGGKGHKKVVAKVTEENVTEEPQVVLPESITFTESQLCDVLDQVESLGTLESPPKVTTSAPGKKSKSKRSKAAADNDSEPSSKKRKVTAKEKEKLELQSMPVIDAQPSVTNALSVYDFDADGADDIAPLLPLHTNKGFPSSIEEMDVAPAPEMLSGGNKRSSSSSKQSKTSVSQNKTAKVSPAGGAETSSVITTQGRSARNSGPAKNAKASSSPQKQAEKSASTNSLFYFPAASDSEKVSSDSSKASVSSAEPVSSMPEIDTTTSIFGYPITSVSPKTRPSKSPQQQKSMSQTHAHISNTPVIMPNTALSVAKETSKPVSVTVGNVSDSFVNSDLLNNSPNFLSQQSSVLNSQPSVETSRQEDSARGNKFSPINQQSGFSRDLKSTSKASSAVSPSSNSFADSVSHVINSDAVSRVPSSDSVGHVSNSDSMRQVSNADHMNRRTNTDTVARESNIDSLSRVSNSVSVAPGSDSNSVCRVSDSVGPVSTIDSLGRGADSVTVGRGSNSGQTSFSAIGKSQASYQCVTAGGPSGTSCVGGGNSTRFQSESHFSNTSTSYGAVAKDTNLSSPNAGSVGAINNFSSPYSAESLFNSPEKAGLSLKSPHSGEQLSNISKPQKASETVGGVGLPKTRTNIYSADNFVQQSNREDVMRQRTEDLGSQAEKVALSSSDNDGSFNYPRLQNEASSDGFNFANIGLNLPPIATASNNYIESLSLPATTTVATVANTSAFSFSLSSGSATMTTASSNGMGHHQFPFYPMLPSVPPVSQFSPDTPDLATSSPSQQQTNLGLFGHEITRVENPIQGAADTGNPHRDTVQQGESALLSRVDNSQLPRGGNSLTQPESRQAGNSKPSCSKQTKLASSQSQAPANEPFSFSMSNPSVGQEQGYFSSSQLKSMPPGVSKPSVEPVRSNPPEKRLPEMGVAAAPAPNRAAPTTQPDKRPPGSNMNRSSQMHGSGPPYFSPPNYSTAKSLNSTVHHGGMMSNEDRRRSMTNRSPYEANFPTASQSFNVLPHNFPPGNRYDGNMNFNRDRSGTQPLTHPPAGQNSGGRKSANPPPPPPKQTAPPQISMSQHAAVSSQGLMAGPTGGPSGPPAPPSMSSRPTPPQSLQRPAGSQAPQNQSQGTAPQVSQSRQQKQPTSRNSKQSKKKTPQSYIEVDSNLSHSIFEPSRSMTPYFPMQNLSPQSRGMQPEGPIFPGNFFTPGPRLPNSNTPGPKNSDIQFNSFFPSGRAQNGLGLNFQPGFGMNMNPLHGNHGNGPQITPHSGSVGVTPHMTNFSLSNIFSEVNSVTQNESLNISPIKFPHANSMLQHQSGMEPNSLQHHHQYNRGHPPPSVMSINSILGPNHHGFDGRPLSQMNTSMAPPFHSHGHPAPFIPPLNFSMHDH